MKTILCLITLLGLNFSVNAQDILYRFKKSQRGQINQIKSIPINLAHSNGVVINFGNEQVINAWLSNISFVTLSSNGCLAQNCDNTKNAPTILYLNRIKDLNLPNISPSSETTLTVSTNQQGLYVFKVKKAPNPSYLVYEITEP
jgi:hypothetical protein